MSQDDELRRLEREAASRDPEAVARLEAARLRAGLGRAHTGVWSYHDDDCRCVEGGLHCNRDDFVWSCCGACKKDSECSGAKLHPTHWSHPRYGETYDVHAGSRPAYRSNEEIRRISPESFE